MIVLYYSAHSPLPALLAAINHCHPAFGFERAWALAQRWQRTNRPPEKECLLIKRFGCTPAGETVYLMSAAVPQPLLQKTLGGLGRIMESNRGRGWFLPAGSLPLWRGGDGSGGIFSPKEAFWKEIKALVEQTRLKVELIKER